MIYARFQASDKGEWETGLLIREDDKHITNLGPNPVLEVRAGLFDEGRVQLLTVMVRAGGEFYETWFNFHQRGLDAEDYLQDWSRQETLAVIFYGSRGRERSLRIRNPMADLAQEALPRLRQAQPWSMSAFDAARSQLYQRYPTVERLWNVLGS